MTGGYVSISESYDLFSGVLVPERATQVPTRNNSVFGLWTITVQYYLRSLYSVYACVHVCALLLRYIVTTLDHQRVGVSNLCGVAVVLSVGAVPKALLFSASNGFLTAVVG